LSSELRRLEFFDRLMETAPPDECKKVRERVRTAFGKSNNAVRLFVTSMMLEELLAGLPDGIRPAFRHQFSKLITNGHPPKT
jgi:hypothetical protein